jgi:nicotinate-nucleotide adenylyltransferase
VIRKRIPERARAAAERPRVAILGGTFDPVHYGHLRLAADVRTALALPEIRLVPAGDPPHRTPPVASARDRVAMLELALPEFPGLVLDTREIARGGKSYAIDTLAELRQENPAASLALLVGADAFRGLPAWHRWRELFDLAHLVVVPRPEVPLDDLPGPLAGEWRARITSDPRVLRSRIGGSIYLQPVTAQPVSSTAIRDALAGGGAATARIAGLLPAAVLAYIESKRLYSYPPNAS